jgi:hypothetical protein
MKKIIGLIICGLFLTRLAYSDTEKQSIGDFFDGKTAEYNVEFKIAWKKFQYTPLITFKKTSSDKYEATMKIGNKSHYSYKVNGFIHENRLYPTFMEEKVKIFIARSYALQKYFYDGTKKLVRVEVKADSQPGVSYEKVFDKDLPQENKQPTDIGSGILTLVYKFHTGQKLTPINVIRGGNALPDVEFKISKKDGITYVKLKDKKQEEDMHLKNMLIKLSKDGWPEVVTVDKCWIMKDIKITLLSLK